MNNIKYSDLNSRSKIIMECCWTKLQGNTCAYLSTSIHQVKLNGVKIEGREEQKKAIKSLSVDHYDLLRLHLCDPFGFDLHMIANSTYHFEQLRYDMFHMSVSKESLRDLQDQLVDSFMTNFDKIKGYRIKEKLLERIKRKHSNDDSFVAWFVRAFYSNTFSASRIKTVFDNLKPLKTEYHKYESMISKAKSLKDIWTIDRYCDYSGFSIEQVSSLLLDPDYKIKLESLLTKQALKNKIRLEELTIKFNLLTIKG